MNSEVPLFSLCMNEWSLRDELFVTKQKAKVVALEEKVRLLEEAASSNSTDKSRSLKELATERGQI